MKLLMGTCILVGGGIGSWLGALMDHGNVFGLWSILWSTVGSLAGIWVAYKINQYID